MMRDTYPNTRSRARQAAKQSNKFGPKRNIIRLNTNRTKMATKPKTRNFSKIDKAKTASSRRSRRGRRTRRFSTLNGSGDHDTFSDDDKHFCVTCKTHYIAEQKKYAVVADGHRIISNYNCWKCESNEDWSIYTCIYGDCKGQSQSFEGSTGWTNFRNHLKLIHWDDPKAMAFIRLQNCAQKQCDATIKISANHKYCPLHIDNHDEDQKTDDDITTNSDHSSIQSSEQKGYISTDDVDSTSSGRIDDGNWSAFDILDQRSTTNVSTGSIPPSANSSLRDINDPNNALILDAEGHIIDPMQHRKYSTCEDYMRGDEAMRLLSERFKKGAKKFINASTPKEEVHALYSMQLLIDLLTLRPAHSGSAQKRRKDRDRRLRLYDEQKYKLLLDDMNKTQNKKDRQYNKKLLKIINRQIKRKYVWQYYPAQIDNLLQPLHKFAEVAPFLTPRTLTKLQHCRICFRDI